MLERGIGTIDKITRKATDSLVGGGSSDSEDDGTEDVIVADAREMTKPKSTGLFGRRKAQFEDEDDGGLEEDARGRRARARARRHIQESKVRKKSAAAGSSQKPGADAAKGDEDAAPDDDDDDEEDVGLIPQMKADITALYRKLESLEDEAIKWCAVFTPPSMRAASQTMTESVNPVVPAVSHSLRAMHVHGTL